MSTGAPTEVAPPTRDEPPPRPWLALVGAVVLLLIGAGLWWFWPESPSEARVPGHAAIGDAPALPDGTGSVGTAADAAIGQTAAPGPAGPGPAGPPTAETRRKTLLLRTEVPRAEPLEYSVLVTISNAGDRADSWRSVALRLSASAVTVTVKGTVVTHEFRAPAHCLIAASPVVLAAGESITLDVTVTAALGGVLGTVESAGLDEAPCPA